jgi:pentatricopeptide repeat protein
MLEDGVQPTSTSYTSLISAYGKAGQVEEALRIYQVGSCRAAASLLAPCSRSLF